MLLATIIASKKTWSHKLSNLKIQKTHTHFFSSLCLQKAHTLPFLTYQFLSWGFLMVWLKNTDLPSSLLLPTAILLTLLLLVFFSTHTSSHYNSPAVSILKERLAVPATPQEKHLHSSQLKCLLYTAEKVVRYIIYIPLLVSAGHH